MNTLKDLFLLDPTVTFLNHGSFGATPKPVFESYQRWQRELERQPVEFLGRRQPALMRAAREAVAPYLGAAPDSLAFVVNVTFGLNVVARGLDLREGDEVLTSNHEYGALDRTWRFLARQRGFRYVNHRLPQPLTNHADFVEAFWEGVTARTRVIFLSHITSPTALIFPVREICRRAREAGILTVIDGAHVPGHIPLDLTDLGADYYSANLHKWLCAPKGCGFLYVRPELQHTIEPLIVSWGYEARDPSGSQLVDHVEVQGTRDLAPFLAAPDAVRFMREHGWDEVRARCHALADQAYRRVVALTGLHNVLRPDDDDTWFGQLVAAPLPHGADTAALKARLYDEYRVEVPLIDWDGQPFVRVSIQGYNTQDDVDRLIAGLRAVL